MTAQAALILCIAQGILPKMPAGGTIAYKKGGLFGLLDNRP